MPLTNKPKLISRSYKRGRHEIANIARIIFPLIFLAVTFCSPQKPASDTSWALLPFEKADSVNPVLAAGQSTFHCPILKQEVKWENKDVFNPAAVVRDGRVHLLYRAEDTVGRFNGTSRLGLAVSDDGFHFIVPQRAISALGRT